MNSINIIQFAKLCGLIKNVKRAGWTRYLKKQNVESVGDHSCRIAMLTMALKGIQKIDQTKCLEMALIHDIGQGIVGDFTPYDKITKQEKFQKQLDAVKKIFQPLGLQKSQYYVNLWLECENGNTYQALIVKDLDKYEMIQQALEYEQKYGVNLQEFYSCVSKMKTKEIKEWAEQLLKQRKQFLQKCDKK